jgi:hypothetical protein
MMGADCGLKGGVANGFAADWSRQVASTENQQFQCWPEGRRYEWLAQTPMQRGPRLLQGDREKSPRL